MSASPALTLAGEFRREVQASVARVWENVWDWEHLAGLHDWSFSGVRLLDLEPDGWRVALTARGGRAPEVERILKLRVDKPGGRYVVTTETGPGAGTEVHTGLTRLAPDRTAVHVGFRLPVPEGPQASALGEAFARSYARLWDEDERMMRRRERLARLPLAAPAGSLDLGPAEAVAARAPFTVGWGELPVRVDRLGGELVAFPAVCPHWLGPLDETPVEDGCVRCPWHDYRFDVRTGLSADGRGLRVRPLLDVAIEGGRAIVRGREGS